jgi:hypothetical protein
LTVLLLSVLLLQVAAFALTPTAQQYSDKHYMPADLLRPADQDQQQAAAALADDAPLSKEQLQQQAYAATAGSASWKCML